MSEATIELFGTIVPDAWIWPEDKGYISAKMLSDALAAAGPETDITLKVNSNGGVVSEGEAMRAAIAAHGGVVTAHVTGSAHSAASLMIMSADEIVMSRGSLMLIHDPRAYRFGTAEDFAHASTEMDTEADAYAQIYADRAGIDLEAARAIMKTEITYSADTAVEAGFADRVADDPDAIEMSAVQNAEAAIAAVMSAGTAVQKIHAKYMATQDDPAAKEGAKRPATGPAAQPQMKETPMPPTTVPNAPVQDPPVAPLMQADVDAAITAERTRASTIRANAAPFMAHLSQADVDAMIGDGLTVEEANAKIMAAAAAGQPTVNSRVEITRDEGETQIEGMVGALMNRVNPTQNPLEGPAEQFGGMRIKQMAVHLGGSGHGFNERAAIRAGMGSTAIMAGGGMGISDFAYITSEVLNRTLAAAYRHRTPTYRRISRQRMAADFRTLHSVKWGADLSFKPVNEDGEYLQSTIEDEASKLKIAKYGRRAKLTFEAVVNDDMGIFDSLPREFSRHGINLESSIAWGLIRNNGNAPDGTALFHADHGNLAAAAAISVTTIGAARKAMWEQRAIGAKDKDDFIEVEPDLLFVPPAKETAAHQFVTATVPTKAADTNPWASSLEPVTEARLGAAAGGSDAMWYLFSSDMPPLEHAVLEGYEMPGVSILNGTNPDDIDMVARHFFAAAISEPRGAYRNG